MADPLPGSPAPSSRDVPEITEAMNRYVRAVRIDETAPYRTEMHDRVIAAIDLYRDRCVREERVRVLEEAAKEMCSLCHEGVPLDSSKRWHDDSESDKIGIPCRARSIRALLKEPSNG